MKKQKLVLTGLVGFAFLFGCNQVDTTSEVSANNSGFTIISEDELNYGEFYKVKDDVTGCYYIMGTSKRNSSTTISTTQMFIEKDGVSVPYCDKVGE